MPADLTREGLAARGTCVYPACMGHTIPGCQGPCKLGIDPMPRQDLTLPPPAGYISRTEHDALIREAEARGMERAASIADECQRQNGTLAKKGFEERYRAGLEAGAQAISAAIRAEAAAICKDEGGV